MMDSEMYPSRAISPLREESGDEEMSLLPRHTKVIVTGNNRTKSVLVGLQGVVKKAVGLGGWHWLVLKNGVEVKLQRNALSVLEHPTGNEADEEYDVDDSYGSDVGDKDHDFSRGRDFTKVRKTMVKSIEPLNPSASSKSTSRNSYRDIRSISSNERLKLKVNLSKLGTKSLRRYCSYFNIVGINADSSKGHLLHAVKRHFVSQPPMDELQVLPHFICAVKRLKSVDKMKE